MSGQTRGGSTGKKIGDGEKPFRTSGAKKEPYGYLDRWAH